MSVLKAVTVTALFLGTVVATAILTYYVGYSVHSEWWVIPAKYAIPANAALFISLVVYIIVLYNVYTTGRILTKCKSN